MRTGPQFSLQGKGFQFGIFRFRGRDVAIGHIYLESGPGPGGGLNPAILAELLSTLDTLSCPWIMAGDWNCSWHELQESSFACHSRAAFVVPGEPSTTHGATIDFAVCSRQLQGLLEAKVSWEVPFRPHALVLYEFQVSSLGTMVLQPKSFPNRDTSWGGFVKWLEATTCADGIQGRGWNVQADIRPLTPPASPNFPWFGRKSGYWDRLSLWFQQAAEHRLPSKVRPVVLRHLLCPEADFEVEGLDLPALRHCLAAHIREGTPPLQAELSSLATVRKAAAEDKRTSDNNRYKTWLEEATQGGMKGLYGALKKAEVTTVRPYRDLPLELRHHERRLDWQRLWEPSSNRRALEDPIFSRLLERAVEQHHALGPVSAEELTKVLKKLSTKAPGLDGLTAPMLKRASVPQIAELADHIQAWEAKGQMPSQDAARKKAAKAGVEAAAAYGHQAVGLAPKRLKFLRQLTAQHNGRLTNGATEVVLDLLCTTKPDPSGRLVEQHFRSFVAMTGNWPQALKPALENAFEGMSQRVASHKELWRIAAGPIGATLCYLKELGWQPSSLLRWEIHSQQYDLEDPLQLEGMLRLLRTFWSNKRLQAICQLEGGASLATGVDWTIGKRLLRKLPPLQKKSLQAVWQGQPPPGDHPTVIEGLWKDGLILEDPDIFYATDGILAAPRWTWFNQSEHKQSDSISIGSVVTSPWSAVDKLAGDHANRSRDRLWESQLEARDADASAVLSFLAARAAALFEYDQDQGPQIQFEGEASSQNQKGRASGFKRKGKVIRPEPAKPERQAGKPNKRDLLREAVLKPQLGHTWKWTSEHQSGARISCTTCKLGAQQISPEKQLRRTLAQPCIGHCSQELFLSFWQCHPTHHMVFEGQGQIVVSPRPFEGSGG
ncbi:unnamed protein product [Symbiodinium sp. CCMP2592]|nr:unnamed protein product [Symbiodinium sp. CCMP2592]